MSVIVSVSNTLTTATLASTTSSSVSASASPTLLFVGPGEMYTCGLSPIQWQYTGPSASMSLNITNINVSQQAPLSASTSSSSSSTVSPTTSGTTSTSSVVQRDVRRQYSGYGGSYFPNINEQIGAQLNATANNYTWPGVNVPQGWYQLLATVQGVLQTTSSSFFVQNGTNVACVPQFASSTKSPVSVTTSPSASNSAVVAASSGHSHAGAIAGGVIGGIAFCAAALIAFLFWFSRRRSRGGQHRRHWAAMALKRSRHEGRSSTRKDHHSGLPVLEADQTFIGSDEELSTVGHEKAITPITSTIMPYNPSHPQTWRTSSQTTASHTRVMSNPEIPLRPPSYQPNGGEAVYPLERPHTSGERTHTAGERPLTAGERPHTAGSGPRRKPAPRYEEAGDITVERNGASSSSTTLDSIHGNTSRHSHAIGSGSADAHALQHQSSFGAMRPMHVIIPDPPPQAHA
jgi:hypothetical protein